MICPSLELSAVVVVGRRRERAQRVLTSLCRQTALDRMEIIVVDLAAGEAAPLDASPAARVIYLERPETRMWARARSEGLRTASAPVVAFTEDHCFPEPGWAEALIEGHRGPMVALGYAYTNANPGTYISRGSMVNDYGFWMHPAAPGPAAFLPGNNISYKREVLLSFGDELETLLTPDFNLQQVLAGRGMPMGIEPRAKAAHLNFESLVPLLHANWAYARLLAARRASTQGWNGTRRLVHGLLTPACAPLLGTLRLLKSLKGRESLRPTVLEGLPVYFITHAWSAIGEALGYLFGEGSAERDLNYWEIEFPRGPEG